MFVLKVSNFYLFNGLLQRSSLVQGSGVSYELYHCQLTGRSQECAAHRRGNRQQPGLHHSEKDRGGERDCPDHLELIQPGVLEFRRPAAEPSGDGPGRREIRKEVRTMRIPLFLFSPSLLICVLTRCNISSCLENLCRDDAMHALPT